MDGIVIRRAVKADAQAVYDLVAELACARDALHKLESTVGDLERDGFGGDPAFEALLAEHNGEAVGLCLYFASYSTWRGRRGTYVQDLVVRESARGLGLGQRLLAVTAALAKARGCTYLRLSVDDDNTDAQGFYQSNGFGQSESELIYVLDEGDFIGLAGHAEGMDA